MDDTRFFFMDSKWSPTCPPQTFKIDAICGGVQTHTLDWASGISDMLLFTVRCFLQLFGFVEQSALFLSPSQHTHFFPSICMFREKLLCKLYLINVSIFIQVYMECMLGQQQGQSQSGFSSVSSSSLDEFIFKDPTYFIYEASKSHLFPVQRFLGKNQIASRLLDKKTEHPISCGPHLILFI